MANSPTTRGRTRARIPLFPIIATLAVASLTTVLVTIYLMAVLSNQDADFSTKNPFQHGLWFAPGRRNHGITTMTRLSPLRNYRAQQRNQQPQPATDQFPVSVKKEDNEAKRHSSVAEPDFMLLNHEISSVIIYPNETPIENPPPADGNKTFSACLLVMDDNHRLVEWIAYHYHVLPLRYLIVATDPRSMTSPTWIFNKWRRKGMYIQEWQDQDFWRPRTLKGKVTALKAYDLKPIPDTADLQTKRDRHRGRQKYFYRSCLLALKEAKRTWVALHDTDEFLVYNHAGGDAFEAWDRHQQKKHEGSAHAHELRIRPAHVPPTTAQAGAMLDYINQERAAGLKYYQSPCVGVPRLSFGAEESTENEHRHYTKDLGFDPTSFDTLRWRKHALRNDFVKNALGKVIMDVSRIDIAKYPYFQSLHRPIKKLCAAPWHNEWNSGLRLNHYLGSWESYSFRTRDARKGGERSLEQWEYKATNNGDETDDNIRPWLSGFVKEHGDEEAQHLLQGAGLPKWYRPSADNKKDWEILPEQLERILSTDKTVANDNKMVQFDAWVREKYEWRRRGQE